MCLLGLFFSALLSSWLLDFAPVPTASLLALLTLLGAWIATRREAPLPTRAASGARAAGEAGEG